MECVQLIGRAHGNSCPRISTKPLFNACKGMGVWGVVVREGAVGEGEALGLERREC